jgi:hypothetical protein
MVPPCMRFSTHAFRYRRFAPALGRALKFCGWCAAGTSGSPCPWRRRLSFNAMKQLIPLAAAFLTACAGSKPDFSYANVADRARLEAAVASHSHLTGVLARCRVASRVEVFEGLRRREVDEDGYARESKRADTFRNHDFHFYAPAMHMSPAQLSKVLSGAVHDTSYKAWSGPKFCGGFHPDLLVRFGCDSGVIDLHLCFGCHEARFFDGSTLTHVDLLPTIADDLKRLQQDCPTKRPVQQQPTRGDAIDSLLRSL